MQSKRVAVAFPVHQHRCEFFDAHIDTFRKARIAAHFPGLLKKAEGVSPICVDRSENGWSSDYGRTVQLNTAFVPGAVDHYSLLASQLCSKNILNATFLVKFFKILCSKDLLRYFINILNSLIFKISTFKLYISILDRSLCLGQCLPNRPDI
jgi:hypothetical protein